MVDAYATSLGSLTLAVDSERFLLEDPRSGCVLSLHPALTLSNAAQPAPCLAVEGFSTADDRMEVKWRAVDEIQATTTLRLLGPLHLRLELTIANGGGAGKELCGVHPLHFPREGPGACTLARPELRTLASPDPDGPVRLMRLHGERLCSELFGAWFTEEGRPSILLGSLELSNPPTRIEVSGARGRMASLRVDSPVLAPRLDPGQTMTAPPLLLALGDLNIREELQTWARSLGDARTVAFLADFDPAAEIVEPEAIPAAEDAAEECPERQEAAALGETVGPGRRPSAGGKPGTSGGGICLEVREAETEEAELRDDRRRRYAFEASARERPLVRAVSRRAPEAGQRRWPPAARGRRWAGLGGGVPAGSRGRRGGN
ncbi:MAG TPA: hypothetical protein VM492_03405 [Sumerlaeia bacterium]|nr:hypothetical protein [Sumerlaeia bacterium]